MPLGPDVSDNLEQAKLEVRMYSIIEKSLLVTNCTEEIPTT